MNSNKIAWRNLQYRYGNISQCLHWLMAFLLAGMLALGFLLDMIPGNWKPAALDLHKSIGITLLGLAALRLWWRLSENQPAPLASIPAAQAHIAQLMHKLLYALMLAMPLSGWAMTSAFGRPVRFFGIIMPDLVRRDREIGLFFKHLHGYIAYGLLTMIVMHAAAALYHHFILKDEMLNRMLARRK